MSPSFLVDSLSARANLLHKLGREGEAAALDERVKAISVKYPQGSVRCTLRARSRPLKRNLRWRFSIFVNAILHPSRFQSNNHYPHGCCQVPLNENQETMRLRRSAVPRS